ncbi:MAG: hypothetical protein ACTSW1_01280 [Candidatus Hodarchaeales archaeon]
MQALDNALVRKVFTDRIKLAIRAGILWRNLPKRVLYFFTYNNELYEVTKRTKALKNFEDKAERILGG